MKFITKFKLVILLVIFLGARFYYNYSWEISGLIAAGVVILYFLLKNKFKRKKPSRYIPDDVKQAVLKRQGFTCCFCKENRVNLLQFHHKNPHALGGSNFDINNIVALCPTCHHMKSKFDLQNKRFK